MLKKILVANRGEIALRVIRACREMGVTSVAVYSDADKEALHVRRADQAVHIGPALSRKSYLNIEAIVAAAKKSGADAVHPGYGFLSENPDFALACEDNGLVFIGPTADSIALAGNKSAAREHFQKLGIPIIPGSDGVVAAADDAIAIAETIGYPVIIKASGGGGGRGMRIAHDAVQVSEAFATAAGEARAAFGNPDLYIEKYIENPRHIELQILADTHGNCIHLGERECSIQKRYQKLIEEAPSPFIDDDLRTEMGAAAIRVARSLEYTNAGTMEFLVDKNRQYYFMEVNARVQVEHPVTEMITGIDIVQEQIRIAAGQPLSRRQEDISINGWSIECRINAADPDNDFMPSPGIIETLVLPAGPGVRMDTHIHSGYLVPPFYDSLIGKLVVWAENREAAIRRMDRALAELEVEGIQVTAPFHRRVMADPDYIKGDIDTHFLERFGD
ncbi:MAG: Biotin carboxylase of acetyl-CoA carboxylase (EC 6.3.4.14) [Olavius algarvensis Delta 4 endosymbiont]|nr:MAG: Biotin carboxylase of acetyl-CoA carboxylase (EC 6.3.4.14) [Olavius algarvensis Delta 4 endosymbiont]